MSKFTLTRRPLFFAFIGVGMLSGLLAGSLGSAQAAAIGAAKTPIKQNRLVVVVDALAAEQPKLLAAWQVQRTQSGTLEWSPLYPAPLQSGSDYAQPHSELRLAGTSSEAVAALPPISAAGIAFDEIFVLDQAAVETLSAMAGGAFSLRSPAAEPQAALQEQVQLVQSLCAAAWQPEHLDAWVALSPEHLQSSVSIFELITRWDAWAQDGFGLNCSHPWAASS